MYTKAALRYSRVKTLFHPKTEPDFDEATLRDLITKIQGFDLSSASSDTMQQVFMTFVLSSSRRPQSVFHASIIDRYDGKDGRPGPTEKIADPAMGTADFLTAAMNYCLRRGDDDAHDRIYGIDSDERLSISR